MINRATARKHLRRLAFLPGGDDAERVDACLDTIQKHFKEECELEAVVNLLMETCDFFPIPARLYAGLSLVRSGSLPEWQPTREFYCPTCEDTGWKQVKGGLYPASVRCDHKQEPDPVDTVPAGMGDEELGV